MKSSKYWIENLKMFPHPEGGYFKEVYRSSESVSQNALPKRFTGDRSFSTSIYFLLEIGQQSAFHRIKSDELWHFYDGAPITILEIDDNGNLIEHKLGLDFEVGCLPQIIIKAKSWFAAYSTGDYTLVGCTVSPGFDFEDFEMADRTKLSEIFPQHKELISKFT